MKLSGRFLFDLILNILVVSALVLIFYNLGSRHFFPRNGETNSATLKPGDRLVLGGGSRSGRPTLVLALSTTCHFCNSSAGFYQDLLRPGESRLFKVVAVFPQPVDAGGAYLKSLGIQADEVLQTKHSSVGITATPTLIQLDHNGRIQRYWVGQLDASQEDEVYEALGVKRGSQNAPPTSLMQPVSKRQDTPEAIALASLKASLARREQTWIIDMRERKSFREGHLVGAINIPYDELRVRAPHEVPLDAEAVLYCPTFPACVEAVHAQGSQTLCDVLRSVMKDLGYGGVRLVSDGLQTLSRSGFEVAVEAR